MMTNFLRIKIVCFFILSLLLFNFSPIYKFDFVNEEKKTLFDKDDEKKEEIYVQFELLSKTLHDLIESLAEIKKINILIPSSLEAEKVVINFATKNQVPLQEVEEYLLYFLNMAGYILTLQNDLYVVTKKTVDQIKRYNLPLYVNVLPQDLPENVGYIRAIYFLKHVKIPLPSGQGSNAIKEILFSILPESMHSLIVDQRTNSIIMTGPANAIAAAMLIVNEIDNFGHEDFVYYLSLKHLQVGYLAKLVEDLLNISKESNPQNPLNVAPYQGQSFFSPQLKIVQDQRNNALILMGKKDAITKLVDFITSTIDIPQESGTPLVHIYDLQFLEAKKIAPVLQDLVNGTSSGDGTDQQSIKDQNTKNNYRKFESVRIIPEESIFVKRNVAQENNAGTRLMLGGNKLIIAATKSDYEQLVKIIEVLDIPQPQVIVEVMVLDLQYDLINNFSSQTRLPSIFNLPEGTQLQSIMWDNSQVMMNNSFTDIAANASTITPQTSIQADLLSTISGSDGGDGKIGSLINNSARNGLIISLGEQYKHSSIWSLLQIRETVGQRSVIDNPTVVTQNNVPAKVQNVTVRRGAGELSPNNTQYGGATVVNIQSYTASLGINITPRISYGPVKEGKNARLNLEINLGIEDWKSDIQNDFTKVSRSLKTNANIGSGDLLVLGGLHKELVSQSISKVPFLGDIPLIGGLFRQTIKEKHDSNLVVIIKATIVDGESITDFSNFKREYLKNELDEIPFSKYLFDDTTKMISVEEIISDRKRFFN
jgi:general secretion pathway protein D